MFKAVIFDLDNTLIDFVRIKTKSVEASVDAMIRAGLKLERQKALEIIYRIYDKHGLEYQEIFQAFLKEVREEDYRILVEAISSYRKTKYLETKTYPNVLPTLIELKRRGLKIGVVSDAPKLQAWIRLADLNLTKIFDFIITAEDVGEKKPNPKPYKKALEILKIEPADILFVGDNPARDLTGARNIGMKTCFARYGFVEHLTPDYNPEMIIKADFEINNISELLEIV